LLQAAATSRFLEYELKLQKGQGSYAVIKASRRRTKLNVRFGSKQTWRHRIVMSALTPKADIDRQPIDVRQVPATDSCTAANSILIQSLHRRAKRKHKKDRLAAVSPKSIEVFHQPFATSKLLY
jgi:hypothetical protein